MQELKIVKPKQGRLATAHNPIPINPSQIREKTQQGMLLVHQAEGIRVKVPIDDELFE